MFSEDDPVEISEDTQTLSLEFLKHNLSPLDEIQLHWSLSRQARKNLLNKSKPFDYFSLFPVLKQSEGYELLLEDFKYLYPGKENCLYEKWNDFKTAVLQLIREKDVVVKLFTNDGKV